MKNDERERKWWLFYDPGDSGHWGDESYVRNCGPGMRNKWTCNESTKKGDMALLYAKRPFSSIVAVMSITTDAKIDHAEKQYAKKPYWCWVTTEALIDNYLSLQAMKADDELRLSWGLVRSQFQSAGPPEIKEPVIRLLERRIPELKEFII